MQNYVMIKRLQKEIGVTTIFVTHDQEEALSMSDRVVVMNAGKIEQISTPTAIYNHPNTEFVFEFIGKSNSFEGRVVETQGREISVKMGEGTFHVDSANIIGENRSLRAGDEVKLYIRPENVHISSTKETSSAGLELQSAKIIQLNYLGTSWEVDVSLQGKTIQLLTSSYDATWQYGSEVYVGWNPSEIMLVKK
jgi:putative spermidine/putrescine transport system ATP-binding protein